MFTVEKAAKVLAASVIAIHITSSFGATPRIEDLRNDEPWAELDEPASDRDRLLADAVRAVLASAGPNSSRLGYSERNEKREYARSITKRAAEAGSIIAELIYLRYFDNVQTQPKVLEAYNRLERESDPRQLYLAGRLMVDTVLACTSKLMLNGFEEGTLSCVPERQGKWKGLTEAEWAEKASNERWRYSERYVQLAADAGYGPAALEMAYRIEMAEAVGFGNLMRLDRQERQDLSKEWLQKGALAGYAPAKELLAQRNQDAATKRKADERDAVARAMHAKVRRECPLVRFTGIASASDASLIERALGTKDVADALARNPIICRSNGACYGLAYFTNHPGRMMRDGGDYYVITSPVDFDTGRRDIILSVRKKDSKCLSG